MPSVTLSDAKNTRLYKRVKNQHPVGDIILNFKPIMQLIQKSPFIKNRLILNLRLNLVSLVMSAGI
jgi:hypothetical protein